MIAKIFNFQFFPLIAGSRCGGTIFKTQQKGFTLIELLASVIVLVAIGSIIAGITSSSLRGANKTNTIENIRQIGNYALNQIAKDITYAQPFDGSSTGFNATDVNNVTTYSTSCPSSPLVDITVQTVQSASNIPIVTKYDCSGSTPESSVLKANEVSLINDTSVSLKSCSLTCTQTNNVPIIGISFILGSINPNGLVENIASEITFKTSIAMRNYK